VEVAEDFVVVVADAVDVVVASVVDVVVVAFASSFEGSFGTSYGDGVPWDPYRCWVPFPFGWVASAFAASVACVVVASSFVVDVVVAVVET